SACERVAVVTASARSLPALTYSIDEDSAAAPAAKCRNRRRGRFKVASPSDVHKNAEPITPSFGGKADISRRLPMGASLFAASKEAACIEAAAQSRRRVQGCEVRGCSPMGPERLTWRSVRWRPAFCLSSSEL